MNFNGDTGEREVRIQVIRTENGGSIEYKDENPETRYVPRKESAWSRFRESWKLAWCDISTIEHGRARRS